ncbi:hypothetical protein TrVFT333_003221 [Trichoderma virens FT-333]|nr:hypothetical protein TrVFT333_003221 [Trichoderma virens FT-333]
MENNQARQNNQLSAGCLSPLALVRSESKRLPRIFRGTADSSRSNCRAISLLLAGVSARGRREEPNLNKVSRPGVEISATVHGVCDPYCEYFG